MSLRSDPRRSGLGQFLKAGPPAVLRTRRPEMLRQHLCPRTHERRADSSPGDLRARATAQGGETVRLCGLGGGPWRNFACKRGRRAPTRGSSFASTGRDFRSISLFSSVLSILLHVLSTPAIFIPACLPQLRQLRAIPIGMPCWLWVSVIPAIGQPCACSRQLELTIAWSRAQHSRKLARASIRLQSTAHHPDGAVRHVSRLLPGLFLPGRARSVRS